MKENRNSLLQREGIRSVAASLLSILVGLLVGSLLIFIVALSSSNLNLQSAWEGIQLIFAGLFSTGRAAAGGLTFGFNPVNIGNMLFRAMPLILTGLSVAVAFKTGLFNIGASGQYLAGTAATLFIALLIPAGALPKWLIWLLAFLGGMLAGAAWGAIPGLLKALLNINEVIACIMTNWIFEESNLKNIVENTKSSYIYTTMYALTEVDGQMVYVDGNGIATAKLGLDKIFPGSQVNAGILVAVLLAVVVYILLNKTTFGFELRACGANRHAARYAGIKDKRNIVLSMAIAGALAGVAGSLYYLSGNTEFYWNTYQTLPTAGFNGIAVALLAVNNPLAVIFSGLFMSTLSISGLQLTNLTAFNEYITDVVIAVIVYFAAFSLVIKLWLGGRHKSQKAVPAEASGAGITPAAESGQENGKEAQG